MVDTLNITALTTGSDAADSEVDAPDYTVYPALVAGIGQHGSAVVHGLRERLDQIDPRLLSVIGFLTLMAEGESWHLETYDQESWVTHDYPDPAAAVGPEAPGEEPADPAARARGALEVLLGEGQPLEHDIRGICRTVGIHEHLEVLREADYKTFDEEHALTVRLYFVGAMDELDVRAGFESIARCVRSIMAVRTHIRCTALLVEPDGFTAEVLPGTMPGADGFDAVYATSWVKEYGFLVANAAEMQTAHRLFLEALLLSDAESTISQCLDHVAGHRTFGAAAVRLGRDEMQEWIRVALALHALRNVYLRELEGTDEGVSAEVRNWEGEWDRSIRALSLPSLDISVREGVPSAALPAESSVRHWCAARAEELASHHDARGSRSRWANPLPGTLAALRHRVARLDRDIQEHLMQALLRGQEVGGYPVERVTAALEAWSEQAEEVEENLTERLGGAIDPTRDATVYRHLDEAIADTAFRMRDVRKHRLPATGVLVRCVILGIVLATVAARYGLPEWKLFGLVLIPPVLIGAPWVLASAWHAEWTCRRLLSRLVDQLSRSLTQWVRTRVFARLHELIRRLNAMRLSSELLQRRLTALRGLYERSLDRPLVVPAGSFLEQIRVDRPRCESIVNEFQARVASDGSVCSLPTRILYPSRRSSPPSARALSIGSLDAQLASAIDRVVGNSIRQRFNQLSLSHQGENPAEGESFAALLDEKAVWELQQRALPLHRVDRTVSGLPWNGHVPEGERREDGGTKDLAILLGTREDLQRLKVLGRRDETPSGARIMPGAVPGSVMCIRIVDGLACEVAD